jgi:GTP-binding protein
VGKSTFVNGLLKEKRVIANDLEGTTRDAITINWIYNGRRVNLVDTAGIYLKNKAKKGEVEQMVRQ